MTERRRRGLAEAVGVLGVIGSLVFVGLEVRESSRATRAATDAEIAGQFLELNTGIYSSPELMEAFEAGGRVNDPSELPVIHRIAITSFYRSLFHVWSNAHRQHHRLIYAGLPISATHGFDHLETGMYRPRRIVFISLRIEKKRQYAVA